MAKAAKQAKLSPGKILSEANNSFAVDIYKALLPGKSSGNLVLSPYSLHSALGMVAQGARGETKTELIKGLKFKKAETDKTIQSGYNYIINDLNENQSFLQTANRIFSKAGFTLNKSFVKILEQDFRADLEQLDFSSRAKCARAARQINRWVEAQTNNKITNLINPDSLDAETCLLLVNCIYFKGKWKVEFNPSYTYSNADFHVTPTRKVQVAMMSKTHPFAYGELPDLDAHVVSLSYRGGKMSMMIFLPKAVDGLPRIQAGLGTLRQNRRNLVTEAMDKFRKDNSWYDVHLVLPKFKIEATIGNLPEALGNDLGMKTMFSETGADFGGIPERANYPPLYVSQVIQKAYISVDEGGTEAAAATAVRGRAATRGRPRPIQTYKLIQFRVDRPFYFEIVDDENDDLVVFSGHVIDPSQ